MLFFSSNCEQARGNLESMMRRQLELRREETRNLHQYVQHRLEGIWQYSDNQSRRKCDTLGARLAELRSTVQNSLKNKEPVILFHHCTFLSHLRTFRKGPYSVDAPSTSTVCISILPSDKFLNEEGIIY